MFYVSHHSLLDEEMDYVCRQLQQEIQHGKPDEGMQQGGDIFIIYPIWRTSAYFC